LIHLYSLSSSRRYFSSKFSLFNSCFAQEKVVQVKIFAKDILLSLFEITEFSKLVGEISPFAV
jgi:hypothetical protein